MQHQERPSYNGATLTGCQRKIPIFSEQYAPAAVQPSAQVVSLPTTPPGRKQRPYLPSALRDWLAGNENDLPGLKFVPEALLLCWRVNLRRHEANSPR